MKNIFTTGIATLLTLVFCLADVSAQDAGSRTINGGVLNGKAVSLVKPAYPDEAREANADGAVAVNVIIDEAGNVISAQAEMETRRIRQTNDEGTASIMEAIHPAFRAAAEKAALESKFSPVLLSGQPVQVKGKIVYNFFAGEKDFDASGKNINGGVLNGKANSLPKPTYPPAALAVRAEGAVNVQVVIDVDGNVIAARAVSGHPLLRAASVAAAREAKFAPTMLSGEPVKVSGVVTYNFVAPKGEDKLINPVN